MAEPKPRPSSEDRIKAALWFAEHGFGVFSVWSADPDGTCRCPLGLDCSNAGKHPIPTRGFLEATTDPGRIRTMLSAGSEPNYGLVCPDGVFALDVDGDGIERLIALEAQMGELPPTLRTKTAHGEHVFLRWPADLPRPIGQLWGFVTRWGAGANAGYVIGPRSVHASGFAYDLATKVVDIAELPDAWAQSVLAPAQPETDGEYQIPGGGYALPEPGFSGSRYNEILRYIASRYMRGMTREEVWAGVVMTLAPLFAEPLSEPDLRSRFDRAWKNTPARLGPAIDFEAEAAAAEQAAAAVGPIAEPSAGTWPAPPDEAAYHGVLGDIVRAVAPTTEADPVAILGSLLAYTGACMGHWKTIYQGSTQAANLFVTLVGDSSTGRKGTAASIARDVMDVAYPDWKKLIVAGLGSGEGLIGHLKKVEETEHRAIVMESEFGRLLTVMAREGSTLSPVVRDAWDGVPMGRFLAREQSLVTYHHVSIAAHVTTVELRSKLTSTDAANGFGNRFLWLVVRRTKLVPFPQSPRDIVAPWAAQLYRAIERAQAVAELHWSPLAADRWEALYADSAGRQRVGLLGSLLARSEAQISRLALLYALLDESDEVGAQHLASAEALWAYAERSVIHIFGESTGDRHADALRKMLEQGPIEWLSARKVLGLRYAAELEEAVGILVSLGFADVVQIKKAAGGGRPTRVIRELRNGAN
ncbi:MAG TPA: bifunctional DNA primase/polymerase [Gaiellaceae bacterium]